MTAAERVWGPTFPKEDIEEFFDKAALCLHWVGGDGTILRANECELRFLGYSRDEYEGHNIREFHADSDVIEDILRRLTDDETLIDVEARMLAKDGSIKDVLINSNVRRDGDGNFLHTRCFTRDITATRFAEQEMKRRAIELNDEVLQEVALAKMSLELNQPDKAQSALSRALASGKAVVSHLLMSSKNVAPGDFRKD